MPPMRTLTVALTGTPRPLYATQRYNPTSRLDACAMISLDVTVVATTSDVAPSTSTSGSATRYHVIKSTTLTGFARTTHSSVTGEVSLSTSSDDTFTISAATVANQTILLTRIVSARAVCTRRIFQQYVIANYRLIRVCVITKKAYISVIKILF